MNFHAEQEHIMRTRYALAALAAATISTFAAAQMGPGMGGGPGMGRGPGAGMADCPMQQGQGMGGGMMGRHGGMHGGGGGMHGGGMHGGMMGMGQGLSPGMLATLNLTPEQQAKVTEIQREQRRKRHAMRGTMQEMRWKSQDAQKDGFNEDAARKQYDAMAAMRKEMFESGLAARKQVDAILTPEQREKLKKARPGPGPKA
jgi:Spy/CpxP family protein refolding chaperone